MEQAYDKLLGSTWFYLILAVIMFTAVSALLISYDTSDTEALIVSLAAILGGMVSVYDVFSKRKDTTTCQHMAEELFLLSYGKLPSKAELMMRPTSAYDQLIRGLSSKTAQVKFWVKDEICKGIVDVEKRVLYMKEPIMMPVYPNESIRVWREVTEMHENGMPKKVEFYDKFEIPHRMDYLDDKGILKKGSWRRVEGTVKYWNPKAQMWEPVV